MLGCTLDINFILTHASDHRLCSKYCNLYNYIMDTFTTGIICQDMLGKSLNYSAFAYCGAYYVLNYSMRLKCFSCISIEVRCALCDVHRKDVNVSSQEICWQW